ncbi:MAG TPA: hypothetical protein VFJ02_16260 [Vicinamibacterales bacterium]|nr:hypothetical protein [Vicinamibacterales bacterium]
MDHDTTSTVLICGHREDPLVEALLDRSDELRLDTVFVTEEQLFTSCPFALVRHGRIVRGYIAGDGRIIDLQRLAGAIVRMPRAWRPSDEFDLKDQMFVYHETMASWFAVLDRLEGLVVNRFPLGWWLHDRAFAVDLARNLARDLDVVFGDRPSGGAISTVYRAGGETIAADGCDDRAPRLLAARADAVARWEKASGIALCQLDFAFDPLPRLLSVDVTPQFDGSARHLATILANCTLEAIVRRQAVHA